MSISYRGQGTLSSFLLPDLVLFSLNTSKEEVDSASTLNPTILVPFIATYDLARTIFSFVIVLANTYLRSNNL